MRRLDFKNNFFKLGSFSKNPSKLGQFDQILYAGSLGYYFRNNINKFPKKSYIKIDQKNIDLKGQIYKLNELIEMYDSHNIFILPSFTEGSPKVILESLARKRPVIIFKEISHVVSNYEGIFISERNSDSLKNLIDYILKNYKQIQTSINSNVLHLKKDFQAELLKILDD